MKTNCLLIRNRDRAMFEPESFDSKVFYSVKYVPRRWWQLRGRFVRSGGQWTPASDSEFELVHRDYVEHGCKIMAERGEL